MAGVVAVRDEELSQKVAYLQNALGTALAPFDCWLLLRSIKTLALRVERAQENAEKVAQFLVRHPAVTRLHYAGPVSDPLNAPRVPWEANRFGVGQETAHRVNLSSSFAAHRLHMRQARGGGSVISFETGSVDFSRRLVDATRLFKLTVSFGSVGCLIELPSAMSHASIPSDKSSIPLDLIRISIGIEDAQDILEDLERAFRVAASNVEDVTSVTQSFRELRDVPIGEIK
jgi:cystathionine beta-lyase